MKWSTLWLIVALVFMVGVFFTSYPWNGIFLLGQIAAVVCEFIALWREYRAERDAL